ncbi:MAG TPA: hypothetical protein VKA95_14390 [Nitrososphaeraceae archaeon]|nr:hypothetical protein [Nitrososphaeraceae archaeon]
MNKNNLAYTLIKRNLLSSIVSTTLLEKIRGVIVRNISTPAITVAFAWSKSASLYITSFERS